MQRLVVGLPCGPTNMNMMGWSIEIQSVVSVVTHLERIALDRYYIFQATPRGWTSK